MGVRAALPRCRGSPGVWLQPRFPCEPRFCWARRPEEGPEQLNFCLLYDPTCKCCDPCWGHGPGLGTAALGQGA